jgi:pimeloyl-ACP methyl ester carboxylesterase
MKRSASLNRTLMFPSLIAALLSVSPRVQAQPFQYDDRWPPAAVQRDPDGRKPWFDEGWSSFGGSTPRVLGRGEKKVTVVSFMASLPERELEPALAGAGISLSVHYGSPSHVDRARDDLRRIIKETEGPIVLAGYSRGGRVAMTLAAMDEFKDSGRIKGMLLWAPQVKTHQAEWKNAVQRGMVKPPASSAPGEETVLPSYCDFVSHGGKGFVGRWGAGFEDHDEAKQETGIGLPTRMFCGLDDWQTISPFYQVRVAGETSNTGIRALFFEDTGHSIGGWGSSGDHIKRLVASNVLEVTKEAVGIKVAPVQSERMAGYRSSPSGVVKTMVSPAEINAHLKARQSERGKGFWSRSPTAGPGRPER